jgi:hypothetical protein
MCSQFRREPVPLHGQVLDVESGYDLISLTEICVAKFFEVIKRVLCICLIQVQLDVHYILYFLDKVSSKCFGCNLHPSSVVCNLPRSSVKVSQTSTCSNALTHQTIQNLWLYAAVVRLMVSKIAPETCTANVVKKIKIMLHI